MSLLTANKLKLTEIITEIIPWFSQFYAKTTTGNSHAHMYAPTVLCTVDNTCSRSSQAANQLAALWNWVIQWVIEVSGCDQLAGGLKVGPGDIASFNIVTPDYVKTYSYTVLAVRRRKAKYVVS